MLLFLRTALDRFDKALLVAWDWLNEPTKCIVCRNTKPDCPMCELRREFNRTDED